MEIDPRGSRFAVRCLSGVTDFGIIFTALALAAAFANAALDYCLGCQMYLFTQRIRPAAR